MTRLFGCTRELLPGEGTAEDAGALRRAGAVEVFADDAEMDNGPRRRLQEWLSSLEPGDTVVVTSAARLSATVPHFVATVTASGARGVLFRSLTEPALCTGADSLVNPGDVFAALDALKRQLASLQTRAGMAAAAATGRRPGRPTVMTPERTAMAVELRNLGRPITKIARVLGVSPNAVQRALAAAAEPGAVESN